MPNDEVSLEDALLVLRACPTAHNVTVAIEENVVTLVKDGVPEVIKLIDPVPRRMIKRLAYKYGIKIEYFFNPEWCVKGGKAAH